LIRSSPFLLAALFALIVAAPLTVKPASAQPATTGAAATASESLRAGDIEQAQYYYRRRVYRPVVVCRTRYTYYGPRRVCYRRY
jgi:hypothetical protein